MLAVGTEDCSSAFCIKIHETVSISTVLYSSEEEGGEKKKFIPTTETGFILSNDCKPAVEITDATRFTIILQLLQ